MAFNALYGAVNDENQTMKLAEGRVWHKDGYDTPEHETFYFDSYTPLIHDRRAQVIGGYMRLQNNRSFGCCLANGGYGLGMVHDFALTKDETGYTINLYNAFQLKDTINEKNIRLSFHGNVYGNGKMTLNIKGEGETFALKFRIPEYETPRFFLNGKELKNDKNEGYFVINREWGNDIITIQFKFPIICHELNGKVAFTRGPIVLAEDSRFENEFASLEVTNKGKLVKNSLFKTNETILLSNGEKLCDFSSAGKNMDDPDSKIAVWISEKR